MARRKKRHDLIRPGKPIGCICCGKPLHAKSEYYCSKACCEGYAAQSEADAPPFLSKWKIRKRREIRDPLVLWRNKVRSKTRGLIKKGVLRQGPCVVCRSLDVVPHHEDYSDSFHVIWLCETHHKKYHQGEISLFGGKLRWDPERLTKVGPRVNYPAKKYKMLKESFDRAAQESP